MTGGLLRLWCPSNSVQTLEISNAISTLPGDFNQDGHVDAADLAAMMSALCDLTAYQATHGPSGGALPTPQLLQIGDLTGDGKVTNADIQAELDLVTSLGGGSIAAVPEPCTAIMSAIGVVCCLAPESFVVI